MKPRIEGHFKVAEDRESEAPKAAMRQIQISILFLKGEKNGRLTKLIPWKKPLRKKLVSVSLDVLKDQTFLEGKL